ncbi:MAG: VTT domain-containing protein [Nitrosomonas ureae]
MTVQETDLAALKKRAWLLVLLILSLIGLGLAWRWTSLGEWLDIKRLVGFLREQGGSIGPLAALAWVALSSVVAIPLAVIIMVSAIAFGPWYGIAYALTGASLGAIISYWVGSALGHEALCRLAGERVNQMSSRLAKRGILSVIAIRMVPIAPFAIINMIAGTTHIRLADFFFGTWLGMLPGALVITVFADQIILALSDPGWGTGLFVAVVIALIVGGCVFFRYWKK